MIGLGETPPFMDPYGHLTPQKTREKIRANDMREVCNAGNGRVENNKFSRKEFFIAEQKKRKCIFIAEQNKIKCIFIAAWLFQSGILSFLLLGEFTCDQ